MKAKTKVRAIWSISSILGLVISLVLNFVFSTYVFEYDEYILEWAFILFIFGLIGIICAILLDGRATIICIIAGYTIGFIIGMIFDYRNGGCVSYGWFFWAIAFGFIALMGIYSDVVIKPNKKRKKII